MANQITVFLDPTQLPARTQVQNTFDANMAAFMAQLPVFGAQFNAGITSFNAAAVGNAYAIPYTIDLSGTTDVDPGAGKLRFDSAMQNAATTLRLDLLGANATDYTAMLDTFDASTSTVKGAIRIIKQGDASTFLLFNVTARAAPSGYRDISVTPVASSSINPFANGDAALLFFQRTGDKGSIGDPGYMNLITSATVTGSPGIIDFLSAFTSAYDTYRVEIQGLTTSTSTLPAIYFANSGVIDSTTKYTSLVPSNTSPSTGVAGFNFPASTQASASTFVLEVRNANSTTSTKTLEFRGYVVGTYYACGGYYTGANAISGLRLIVAGASFTGGTIRIYGIKNT